MNLFFITDLVDYLVPANANYHNWQAMTARYIDFLSCSINNYEMANIRKKTVSRLFEI